MKKPNANLLLLSFALLLGMSATQLRAQSANDKKEKSIRVKVVEKKNGKTTVQERNYTLTEPLSDSEQKAFVDKVLDSMNVDGMSQKQISIRIDEDGDNEIKWNQKNDRRRVEVIEGEHEPMVWGYDNDRDRTFHFDTREFEGNMRRLEKEMKPKVNIMMKDMERLGERMGDFWTHDVLQSGSVRALNAFPNNPDNGVLNLRFTAPEKGDITITVTDTDGKEVGKKQIKDFSGEFVGQIELKKNTKGTLFVTVTQKEDGAVRRVVIK
ncbi:T9SS type A sorting domain-containing protein [Arundinibacter roseus]|uniref:T9SS type A sorting domain-containing protein n=1 Tax=Arundinibacter roseus TaxID=2070510 RepID=A0A4R4KDL9_9BACT|nr:T9SS type A sorting domain-containing protein [Arundinibacter roseus]TDB66000.1 T9SS type A sorting domain-containing protein [Arundinibacter roseus]